MRQTANQSLGCRPAFLAALLILGLCGAAEAGQVELISKADPALFEAAASADYSVVGSKALALSADGRYAVFASSGLHLVPGQMNVTPGNTWFFSHLYLFDRITGTMALVSHSAAGTGVEANSGAAFPSISADGRYVTFISNATDLVPGQVDNNRLGDDHSIYDGSDVFLYDRISGAITLVSHRSDALTTTGNGDSYYPKISADGSWISFQSSAPEIFGAAQGDVSFSVYLYSRATGTNTLVSHTSSSPGIKANASSYGASLSSDGGLVVFSSSGTNLLDDQFERNTGGDVFLYERSTGAVTLVTQFPGAPGWTLNGTSFAHEITADGRFIVFVSEARDVMWGLMDQNASSDIFVYDRSTGTTSLVSHASTQPLQTAHGPSDQPRVSTDGRYVAFESRAGDLVAGLTGGSENIYLHDRVTGATVLANHTTASPVTASVFGGDRFYDLSADGRYVVFISPATDLVSGQVDVSLSYDLFVFDRDSGATRLVSHAHGSSVRAGNKDTALGGAIFSADGSRIAFISAAGDLEAGSRDFNESNDVYLYDMSMDTHQLVSRWDSAVPFLSASGNSFTSPLPATSMSTDGRFVAFVSRATNLIAGQVDPNEAYDVFLRDRALGTTTLVSRSSTSPTVTGQDVSGTPVISADGRWVAFASYATDLVPGQSNALDFMSNVFLYDRDAGATTLVSHASSSPTTSGFGTSGVAGISADGRYVLFYSAANDLVAGQVAAGDDFNVFLYDRDSGAVTLVSHEAGSPLSAAGFSGTAVLNADGRYIAFISKAPNILPGYQGYFGSLDVYLYDRVDGTIIAVTDRAYRDYRSASPVFSADGRYLAFASTDTGLVPGQSDTYNTWDVFLYDRVEGTRRLVSHAAGSPATAGNEESRAPSLSMDGRYLAFESQATDLMPGVGAGQVYLFDRDTGARTLASRHSSSPSIGGNGASSSPAISADGSRIAFVSQASDLLPGGTTGTQGIFLFDRAAGTTSLASRTLSSATSSGNGGSEKPVINADGRAVAFASLASDLASGDFNYGWDVFAYSLGATGQTGSFFTLSPCRLLDTRMAGQGPAIASGAVRLAAAHGACGIPPTAAAVAINVTVTQPSATGHLSLHAGDAPAPFASTLNFGQGQTRANNAILPLAANGSGTLAVTPFVLGNGTVHVIVDVVGYFE